MDNIDLNDLLRPINTSEANSIQQAINKLTIQDINKAQKRDDNRDDHFYGSLLSSNNEFSNNIKNNKDYYRDNNN